MSLDTATEAAVTTAIGQLHGDVTVITVAHRLSTIRDADVVFFMRNGTVAAYGTFDDPARALRLEGRFFRRDRTGENLYAPGRAESVGAGIAAVAVIGMRETSKTPTELLGGPRATVDMNDLDPAAVPDSSERTAAMK